MRLFVSGVQQVFLLRRARKALDLRSNMFIMSTRTVRGTLGIALRAAKGDGQHLTVPVGAEGGGRKAGG